MLLSALDRLPRHAWVATPDVFGRAQQETMLTRSAWPAPLPFPERRRGEWSEALRAVQIDALGQRLREIEGLPENWDGEGAHAIEARVVENLRAILRLLLPAGDVPFLSPNPHGTVSLEWERANAEVHLEIGSTSYALLIRQRDQPSIHILDAVGKFQEIHAALIRQTTQAAPAPAATLTTYEVAACGWRTAA